MVGIATILNVDLTLLKPYNQSWWEAIKSCNQKCSSRSNVTIKPQKLQVRCEICKYAVQITP